MRDGGDVWVMQLRSRSRFAQEARAGGRVFRHAPVDHLERNRPVEHRVTRAIRHRHRTRPELNRLPVRAHSDLEMSVAQRTHGGGARRRARGFLVLHESDEATQTFAVWSALCQRPTAPGADVRRNHARFTLGTRVGAHTCSMLGGAGHHQSRIRRHSISRPRHTSAVPSDDCQNRAKTVHD